MTHHAEHGYEAKAAQGGEGGGAPKLKTENPATGKPGRTYDGHTREQALAIAGKAREAFPDWRRTSFTERGIIIGTAARILRERKDEFARLMADEMGKPVTEGLAEIEKCAFNCDYFVENAERFLANEPVKLDGGRAYVTFNPLGSLLAVMPWNFPFWQVFRAAAPALMAGNTVLLKHASNVPGCALAIEDVFREAGAPDNVFRTILIAGRDTAELIDSPDIAAVTLTGSVAAGKAVAEAAGRNLKKTVLELGGSDAYLVLEDADIDHAATVAATARMVNGGQSCIAGKRFVVVAPVREAFETGLAAKMSAIRMGDPLDPATKLGPMVSVKARDEIHRQVRESIGKGARLLCGGEVPDRPGAWYPPTVLTDVKPGQPAYDEEVFGPVAAIIEARDVQDAIRIANDSEFGLGAGVLTRDIRRGEEIAARDLEAGIAFVNENVRSDPRMPFGGVKHSGYGRECGVFGIREFVNIKSVHVRE
ncbi:NAD-dependent succinate-semialdehyde dehydrogenase [Rhodomicrobium udaipurense]|uniref:NAD-dependent succinate-semialdehyde dehydrogenase n=1 Tax=Rhodomicrobium udaipurense TaxID=1202716 RepID=A0A8I1GI31_9HYPH|nr:NAD-dependent succinate-semialdehyde dehydrogenase [Rhodomicrobium udaipurense]MBJ7543607.1 NAD-dependent succinate-semialdehyde dehydrogenase [Rhodomicrobium udaipurense]